MACSSIHATQAAVSSEELFKYDHLDHTRKQIRLLQLVKSDSATIACELIHCDMENMDMPQYQALSYTWGPITLSHIIIVNGKQFIVRQNLYEFLKSLRHREQNTWPQWIWIDQLSINQDSITERNHQVSLMAEIYKRARLVIIWLGSAGIEHAHFAVDFLHGPGGSPAARIYPGNEGRDKGKAAMRSLCQNPYWSRLWIVQEIKLARELTIHWADVCIDPCNLNKHRRAARKSGDSFVSLPNWKAIDWLLAAHSGNHGLQDETFYMHIAAARTYDRGCQDPRDKVYAVQALLPLQSRLQVDYSKGVEQIFIEAIQIIVEEPIIPFGRHWESPDLLLRIQAMHRLGKAMMPEIFDDIKLTGAAYRNFTLHEVRLSMSGAELSAGEKFQILVAESLKAIKMERSAHGCLRALDLTYELVMQFIDTLDRRLPFSGLSVPSNAKRQDLVAMYDNSD